MSTYEEDAAIRENMIAGSRDLLQSIVEARKGWPMHPDFNRFIWSGKDSASGSPISMTTIKQGRAVAKLAIANGEVNALRVSRDPCARCSVRGDVRCGCASSTTA